MSGNVMIRHDAPFFALARRSDRNGRPPGRCGRVYVHIVFSYGKSSGFPIRRRWPPSAWKPRGTAGSATWSGSGNILARRRSPKPAPSSAPTACSSRAPASRRRTLWSSSASRRRGSKRKSSGTTVRSASTERLRAEQAVAPEPSRFEPSAADRVQGSQAILRHQGARMRGMLHGRVAVS